ncbi:type II toxin-antitoxin system VapC family toxin [Rhodopseudomonas palustris]|uniref:Ribonuclease VapC n=1 Tax=Thiospirillum jenense TaxID=1653858 RepID=A0A839HEG1_9GAMM|nr:type II toxin-antitoxin system VapC family toxin [Thiospirillum jenense]MBB1089720.1 type II toxin-antitoxin system VapC family toxin [Rhodopseudomonas palustris]MBB1124822.1 type II toxin-antitoxin system VapC family toxin [Thiospirillum jenense]
MIYLLDTNTVIALLKNHAAVTAQIQRVGTAQLRICAPVEAELWFGVNKSIQQEKNRQRLLTLLTWLPSLPFTSDAALHYGEIRAVLTRQGTPIGPYDLQIAAIARANQLVVVTHNTSEFCRVPGLLVEDWLN